MSNIYKIELEISSNYDYTNEQLQEIIKEQIEGIRLSKIIVNEITIIKK